MEISKALQQHILTEFNLIEFQRIPFSFNRLHKFAFIEDVNQSVYSEPIPVWTSTFQKSSGTKYICGIGSEHIRKIAETCSCLGDYGLKVEINHISNISPLAEGHMINLNKDKNYLKKAYSSKEEFIKENPSPVSQNIFSEHKIVCRQHSFTADIVYRAIFEIVHPELFNYFIEIQKNHRHIKNAEPVKVLDKMFAQDTYLKLIF